MVVRRDNKRLPLKQLKVWWKLAGVDRWLVRPVGGILRFQRHFRRRRLETWNMEHGGGLEHWWIIWVLVNGFWCGRVDRWWIWWIGWIWWIWWMWWSIAAVSGGFNCSLLLPSEGLFWDLFGICFGATVRWWLPCWSSTCLYWNGWLKVSRFLVTPFGFLLVILFLLLLLLLQHLLLLLLLEDGKGSHFGRLF